ncbi:translation initiation factor IF-2-like isoform X3 [Aquila chrysaetos chrysaetos]|uniref:translation initiation factor IF-2-like isoform X3 n=1 Tax=Aquila chrysaetos chrysaetos TaxID=223781 RepID=UPI001B7D47DE|nr:translation initiation factor IF-2-like isoform X3 [Aquila chrysaetos chrysaetos]
MIHSPFHEGQKQIMDFRLNNSILSLEEISLVASMGGGAGPVAGLRNRPAGSRGKTPRRTAGSVSDARSGSGAAPCRSCTERAGGSAGTAAAPAWGWAETEAASPRGQAAGRAASRGMPGAVVFADSAAGQQRGSRARRSPRCRRRGPRSPTGSDSGASPVSRGFPRASRCARSPTSRVDAPPCAVLQPGVRAPAPAPPAHAWSPGAAWRCAGRGSRRQRASAGTAVLTAVDIQPCGKARPLHVAGACKEKQLKSAGASARSWGFSEPEL